MVPFPARRADDREPLSDDADSISRVHPEIEELASRLAAQGIQSTDLVVDLVLHDIADEARQAVGGSGTAIALERDGELVCRAAAGSTAPDLGIRINRESGLSGTCIKQGAMQVCGDAETDLRVDAEACRRLGVRSIAVLPLFSQTGIIGVLEVFSDRVNAFSAADLCRLESLAAAAAESVKTAADKSSPPFGATEVVAEEPVSSDSAALSVAEVMQKVTPVDPAVKVLRWLVIGLAIPVVILIGFDWGWNRARAPQRNSSSALQEQREAEPQADNSQPVTLPDAAPASTEKKSPARPKAADDLTRYGGLIIYHKGRIIYREGAAAGEPPGSPQKQTDSEDVNIPRVNEAVTAPANTAEKAGDPLSDSLAAGLTGGRLLHRVRPTYPANAIAQKLQGPVLLRGVVEPDGTIRDLKLVQGNPILAEAALAAVQQWRCEPYRRNGSTIAMPIDITIDFNLPK